MDRLFPVLSNLIIPALGYGEVDGAVVEGWPEVLGERLGERLTAVRVMTVPILVEKMIVSILFLKCEEKHSASSRRLWR